VSAGITATAPTVVPEATLKAGLTPPPEPDAAAPSLCVEARAPPFGRSRLPRAVTGIDVPVAGTRRLVNARAALRQVL
jgi:hypothetical protein